MAVGSVYVHADVTAVFPWLTYALLSDPKMKKKPLDLLAARAGARDRLMREIAKRRADLVPTMTYPLPRVPGAVDMDRARGRRAGGPKG